MGIKSTGGNSASLATSIKWPQKCRHCGYYQEQPADGDKRRQCPQDSHDTEHDCSNKQQEGLSPFHKPYFPFSPLSHCGVFLSINQPRSDQDGNQAPHQHGENEQHAVRATKTNGVRDVRAPSLSNFNWRTSVARIGKSSEINHVTTVGIGEPSLSSWLKERASSLASWFSVRRIPDKGSGVCF